MRWGATTAPDSHQGKGWGHHLIGKGLGASAQSPERKLLGVIWGVRWGLRAVKTASSQNGLLMQTEARSTGD